MTTMLGQGMTTIDVEQRIELARWSTGNAFIVGAAAVVVVLYAVVWLYRREARGQVDARLRWMLITCRAMVLLLLGVVGLEPVLVDYVHRRQNALTLVLVDESASMSLADRYRGEGSSPPDIALHDGVAVDMSDGAAGTTQTQSSRDGIVRSEVAESILNGNGGRFLRKLVERNSAEVFGFSDGCSLLRFLPSMHSSRAGSDEAEPEGTSSVKEDVDSDTSEDSVVRLMSPIRIKSEGATTDIGQAVREAVVSVGNAPVAAVVVLSDGGFNAGEPSEIVARFLEQQGVPLFAIGVGDPSDPINVGISAVLSPRTVFKNDPFDVTVHLDVQGLAETDIEVELLRKDAEGAEAARVVGSRTVRVGLDGTVEPLRFACKVDSPGDVSFVARVTPVEFESILSDNSREIHPAVQVLDDEMRVLIVAGAPSYDYRFLSRLLERDVGVDVSTWLQSAETDAVRDGDTVITNLPAKPADLFEYDAIILLDCDPRGLPADWGDHLAAFVSDHGGGVLYAAGNKYTGAFLRSTKTASFTEVLPVVRDPDAELILNDLGQYQTRAWPLLIPERAASSAILRQGSTPGETRLVWSALTGIYWHYPIMRAKPIADVLMEHSNPRMANTFGQHVLFATQFVGAGRTAYLGFNSTWRWRRGDERYFNRFWIQTLRYLVEGRLAGGQSRGAILANKDAFDLGESVVLTVRALTDDFQPLLLPALDLVVVTPDATSEVNRQGERASRVVTLVPVLGREGYYQGRFTTDRIGPLRLLVALPGGGDVSGQETGDQEIGGREASGRERNANVLRKEIIVAQPDIEMRDTAMNREMLERLANATGGQYLSVDEAERVADLILDCSRTPPPSRGRPRPLWDNHYVLFLLLAFLTAEWIMRKRARLL